MYKNRNITHGYTKHYYAGSERIVSKVGGGGLSDIDADPKGEYSAELAEKKDAVKTEYNMAWGCLETLNPVFGNYLTCIGEWSGNVYNVAQEQTCPFFKNLYSMKEATVPENDLYFYHSDHLGSASWITNANGQAIQHLLYLPFGETMVDQRTTSWSSRYSFSAKEKDEESGYHYFGARYYDSDISIWLSVDPMASELPHQSPYIYCSNHPINRIDPTGMLDDDIYYNEKGNEIYRVVNDKPDRNFVIKTTQTTNEMYEKNSQEEKGWSRPISAEAAATTESEISKGNLSGDHMKNVMNIGTTESIEKMMSVIKDDGTGGTSAANNCEYGGFLDNGKVTATKPGTVGDPTKKQNASIVGDLDFHSHPSGTKGGMGWQQPPSRTDINTANKGTNYVFGMRSQTIYIFDKGGVKATIPMSIFKK